MTPQELSDAVLDIVSLAQSRVGPDSIGAQQYYIEGQPQKFETMTFEQLLEYTLEESLDLVNYGVMQSIKILRLQMEFARRAEIEDLSDALSTGDEIAPALYPVFVAQSDAPKSTLRDRVRGSGEIRIDLAPLICECDYCRSQREEQAAKDRDVLEALRSITVD